jgi:hypothetical protein
MPVAERPAYRRIAQESRCPRGRFAQNDGGAIAEITPLAVDARVDPVTAASYSWWRSCGKRSR